MEGGIRKSFTFVKLKISRKIILIKIRDAILSFTKVRIFLIAYSIEFLNPKILGFLFLQKYVNWGLKCGKLTLENRREFISYTAKIVHEWNGHLEIFTTLSQALENSRKLFLVRTDIL